MKNKEQNGTLFIDVFTINNPKLNIYHTKNHLSHFRRRYKQLIIF